MNVAWSFCFINVVWVTPYCRLRWQSMPSMLER